MLSNKINFILTVVITLAVYVYMKKRQNNTPAPTQTQEQTSTEELPLLHPLKHPEVEVVDVPTGTWADGFIYIHDVMDYIFASEAEKTLAVNILLRFGYGQGKKDYLYFNGKKSTVNGKVFETYGDAKAFLISSNIKKLQVFIKNKEDFPAEIKTDNVKFFMIPWDKRDLPEIEL